MLKLSKTTLLIIFSLMTSQSIAYPVFFKCGAGDRLESSFAGPELYKYVDALLASTKNDEEFREQALMLCKGANECVEELEKIKSMLGSTQDITAALMEKVAMKRAETAVSEIDPERFNAIQSYVENAYTIRACEEVKQTWSKDAWTHENGDNFAVFYPKYSNYMYVSGCSGKSGNNCLGNRISSYENRIKSALLMGMDPYLAISLVWMEGGTGQGLDYLYLDPIGKFAALGCTSTPRSSSQATESTLNSYSTYYDIDPKVVKNPALTSKLKDFLNAKGHKVKTGKSYFCRVVNDSYGSVFDSPQENSCCLELPYAAHSGSIDMIEEALVFEQARKNYQRRFREEADPAFRIQRFNGYSRLMGGAEPVEAFRAGVNHYDDPAYGYQAMDYIVNSLLTNPVIHQMVEQAEKEVSEVLGRKPNWRSIMCVEHAGGGTFHIDSEHYFNKHRDTDRFKAAHDKWKNGQALSDRELNLILYDVQTLVERRLIDESELDQPQNKIIDNYFRNHYAKRNTVGSASTHQSSYTWENLTANEQRVIGRQNLGR